MSPTISALLLTTLLSLLLTTAAPSPGWYHPPGSPIAELFSPTRRGVVTPLSQNDPKWASQFPYGYQTPPTTSLPAAWLARLKQVTDSPGFPKYGATDLNKGFPLYNHGQLATSDPSVCSFTYGCVSPDDIYNAPDGTIGLSFDDGPQAPSQTLYPFLSRNNISATHFMIGANVLGNPGWFNQAVNQGGHIAVHTWSHPYMTTLTNEQIVAELGWTMEVIANLNWGKVPKYWRPPYGDVDNRVRAIASGVFGLTTVVWNRDTADWAVGSNPAYTHDSVMATVSGYLRGSKSPGLIMLEHELSANSVGIFMDLYPIMQQTGWAVKNIADAMSQRWYLNSDGSSGTVSAQEVVATYSLNSNGTSNISSGPGTSPAPPIGNSTTSVANATSSAGTSANSTSLTSTANTTSTAVPTSASTSAVSTTAAPSASAPVRSTSSAEVVFVRLGWTSLVGLGAVMLGTMLA